MATAISQNRQMFWRIIRRMVSANLGRLFVMLLALGAGAAVTAALLNLQVDAKHRLTSEFRAFGANVVVTAPTMAAVTRGDTLDASTFERLANDPASAGVTAAAFLYVVSSVRRDSSSPAVPVVVVGYKATGGDLRRILPSKSLEGKDTVFVDDEVCDVGEKLASVMRARTGEPLLLKSGEKEQSCDVGEVLSFGGAEDNDLFLPLHYVQALAGLPNRISVVDVNVPGGPKDIESYTARLQTSLHSAIVRPVTQFTESQAKIYGKISGLLTATLVVVLVLTSLCVMAAMTNVAMERKNDVGLMKAIGGATRRVLRLFLMEALLLGFAGGLIGAAAGILLSIWLGKQVFGVAAQPRLIVYPVAVALTVVVAILSAFPLRRLASIRPASVFRGEA